jgi:methionyl-tRNA formyltransferase
MPDRIVFLGTVEFSRHMLDETLKRKGNVCAVWSLTREHAGRIPDWRDLSDLTRPRSIEHHEVRKLATSENIARIRELRPDAIFAMGLPETLPPELLAIPRLGTIGSHPSALPRNRGETPIPGQILHGETEGGLTFFLMGEGVEDGPIVSQRCFKITLTDTAGTLYAKTIAAGREMLGEVTAMLERGQFDTTPQDESRATYLPVRCLDNRRIEWKENARRTYDLVRAMTEPYPGAFCYLGAEKLTIWEAGFSHQPVEARPGEIVRIFDRGVEVATGAGLLVIRTVQVSGEKEHALDVFVRAHASLGTVLT